MDGSNNASAAAANIWLVDNRFKFCLDAMYDMATAGLGPGCIKGDMGAGKSTLLRALEQRLLDAGHWVVRVNDESLATHHILVDITQRLGISCQNYQHTEYVLSLIADALYRAAPQRRMVLLVDDAETLSSQSWGLISRLAFCESTGSQLLPAVFVTSESFSEWQWTMQMTLGSYSREGIRSLAQQLAVAAGGRISFSEDAIELLYEYSGGLPGNCIAVAQQAISAADWHRMSVVDSRVIESVFSSFQQQATYVAPMDDDDEDEQPTGWFGKLTSWSDSHPTQARRIMAASAFVVVAGIAISSFMSETRIIVAPEAMKTLDSRQENGKPEDSLQLFEAQSAVTPAAVPAVAKADPEPVAPVKQKTEAERQAEYEALSANTRLSESVDTQSAEKTVEEIAPYIEPEKSDSTPETVSTVIMFENIDEDSSSVPARKKEIPTLVSSMKGEPKQQATAKPQVAEPRLSNAD